VNVPVTVPSSLVEARIAGVLVCIADALVDIAAPTCPAGLLVVHAVSSTVSTAAGIDVISFNGILLLRPRQLDGVTNGLVPAGTSRRLPDRSSG
jgi:hypothetical protein